MGRNKPRSKAVDVTKSLLQPTSVTDHIAVQINPNFVIQVAEEDLSPTQGSEAAFALRREGKLDTTMKLCLNWRQGNCHNHAACSFAHVVRYFGVTGDLPSPVTTGRTGAFSSTVGGGTYSSVAGGSSTGRSGAAGSAAAASATSWSQKLAPPSYSATASRGATTSRADDRKAAPQAAAATATSKATTETKPGTPPAPQAAVPGVATEPVADSAASTRSAATTSGESVGAAREMAIAPPTPASLVRPALAPPAVAAASLAPTPPAVLSAEGLRLILGSLSATAAGLPAGGEDEEATAAPSSSALPPREFLSKLEAAAGDTPAAEWQQHQQSVNTVDEILDMLGKLIIGEAFDSSRDMAALYQLCGRACRKEVLRRVHSQAQSDAIHGHEAAFGAPLAQMAAQGRLFSTAPIVMPSATSSIGQLGGAGISLGGAHDNEVDDGDLLVPGLSYQHLMNMFGPEE
ncbi:hypothetical protein ABB37_04598 [Leptomonas pyrrhocoris]|uniref:C3H1-type domain-containing protein n=1 Tax=Leptomonas pyrrhocoris TaxID=157538 RepID=A0A0M9G183_LEPPY|nr:hypothetical protein ABB37_04598 [Leptomonas pyrrhocoris]XP_015658758.1 hypothetical protein ABB37_04598 [Leptomonas pyrrhocoris]XP_015658759.1 hypothetical protein ABB37_04598 [Leptomonas pyrrhocoris]KPA80318.1 hypothetical protein ABB37_04598 [Leptomonas pyrrhocoris]KPA80319.1 hypothetical protein ABB37_04598 [Leptomonas pyrrhocoris]KPA80320.1 hypothetical protein ABB37_04598 [Leptomonas pyrrhocoris]|eukprot:XP_015658757.1 hypothetical protein ABB37_04598 [Leptomonas pyrrhocoris]